MLRGQDWGEESGAPRAKLRCDILAQGRPLALSFVLQAAHVFTVGPAPRPVGPVQLGSVFVFAGLRGKALLDPVT